MVVSLSRCSPSLTSGRSSVAGDLTWVAEDYLRDHIFEPAFGGRIFCESEVLQVVQQGDAIKAYLWVLCAEYYPEGEALQMGTAVSEPLLVYMLERDGQYLATGFAEPRSGELQLADIQRIFPPEAIAGMCLADVACSNTRVQRLMTTLEMYAENNLLSPIATGGED
jgi:hypothetical protein